MSLSDVGNFAIIVAFAFAIFSVVTSLLGVQRRDPRMMAMGERGTVAVFLLVTLAMFTLWAQLLADNFQNHYVAGHSNRDLSLTFKIGTLWAGQEGSLLLWTWVLTGFSAIAVLTHRKRHNRLLPYAIGVLMTTGAFFLYLNNFRTNPFEGLVGITAKGAEIPWAPQDGRGLNPLLQHWAMVIHPPILYIGYIGFVVPFAFCLAALYTRQLGSAWVQMVRRWTLVAWIFLSCGILLGGKWAYMELGWGGYWAWDPVENASLLPWLAGTAFLHSIIVQEKRGMLKVWNVTLICLTFLLSIFGTFMTRSGVVSSVHAFAQSNVGWPFGIFILSFLGISTWLIISRLPDLRSESRLDSMVSRESGFLFNNLLLLAATMTVLIGTVFPMISEMVTGRNVSVGQAYFNKVEIPLGLALLALTGIGPLLAYRKTSNASLRRNFFVPVTGLLVAAPILFATVTHEFWPLLSLTLCVFVTLTILQEFHKGARARVHRHSENHLQAIMNLTRRNNRRYGGYIVHFGIVLIFLGATGQAFTREVKGTLGEGDDMSVGPYRLHVDSMTERENANYWAGRLDVTVYKGDRVVTKMQPEKRYYFASEQPSSEVSIHRQLSEDIYVVHAGYNEDQTKAVVQAYVNPLVQWVWIGGVVLILGTFLCLLPPVHRRRINAEVGS